MIEKLLILTDIREKLISSLLQTPNINTTKCKLEFQNVMDVGCGWNHIIDNEKGVD